MTKKEALNALYDVRKSLIDLHIELNGYIEPDEIYPADKEPELKKNIQKITEVINLYYK